MYPRSLGDVTALSVRVWAIAISVVLQAATSRADEPTQCLVSDRPWVRVVIDETTIDPTLRTHLERELRSDLGAQQIDVCAGETQRTAPLAIIRLAQTSEAVAIDIHVHDAVTDKDVSRAIDLRTIPADSRALAVAAAADELLRASWAELALQTAPAPVVPPPAPVRASVSATLRHDTHRLETMLGFDGEAYTRGQIRFGMDARVVWWFVPRIAAGLRVGYRAALPVTAVDGQIDASAVIAGLNAMVALTPRQYRFGIDALTRVDVSWVTFVGIARTPNSGTSATQLAVDVTAGVQPWIAISRLIKIRLEIAGGYAPYGAIAADQATQVTGAAGVVGTASVLVSGNF